MTDLPGERPQTTGGRVSEKPITRADVIDILEALMMPRGQAVALLRSRWGMPAPVANASQDSVHNEPAQPSAPMTSRES